MIGISVYGVYGCIILLMDDEVIVKVKIEDEVWRYSNNFEWYDDGSFIVIYMVLGM